MKRKLLKILIVFSVFAMVFMVSNTDAQAASKKWKKACKKYKTFLAKNESEFEAEEGDFETKNTESYKTAKSFLIVDLDKDGVPELVTYHEKAYKTGYLYIFRYKKGKIKPLKDEEGNTMCIDVTCAAGGWYKVYKCKKGHLHTDWADGMYGCNNTAYGIKKGKLQVYLNYIEDNLYDFTSISKNGEEIGKKKYNSLISKCTSKKTYLVANTKSNRKKYCK